MAQRRMFSPTIVESDAFLDMPISTQALYFHLGMFADDDGFINPKKIMRMIGVSEDDLKVLITKRFVLTFENGVVVIKHWCVNNLVRKDWYRETQYIEQKKNLLIKKDGSYTEDRQHFVNGSATQVRLGKVRLGKVNKKYNKKEITVELPEWLDKKSWSEWEQHRKEIRHKLTPSTIKKQIALLEKNIPDHIAMIEKSIEKGWTGLFPLNENKSRKKSIAIVK